MNARREDACWSLVTHFRSISVLTIRDEATGALLPSLEDVGRWLSEFNLAYVQANALVNAGRLHAFGGRRLLLSGDDLLPEFAQVGRLCEVARQCGLAVTLSFSLAAAVRHALGLATLRSTCPGLDLQIDCTALQEDGLPAAWRDSCASTLRALARTAGELHLVGAIEPLRAMGLMSAEEFNRSGFTVSPVQAAIRPVHRLHHVAPCRDYLSLFIDPLGDIYPCHGLLRHEAARLGSLKAPFDELMPSLARTRENFDILAPLGPRVAPRIAERVESYPVDLCALHRQAVAGLDTL